MKDYVALREKIGQMLLLGFDGLDLHDDHPMAKSIINNQVGGVILFDYDIKTKKFEKNIKNPEQLKKLTQQLQHYANNSLLIAVDYEGGAVNRLKSEYGFPETKSAASVAKLSLLEMKEYAERMAKTLVDAGINLNFAPILDVNLNHENPILGKLDRCFSDDPKKIIQCAEVFYQAFAAHNIISTYKHFPGHGSSVGDSHLSGVDVSDTWQEIELLPYQNLLKKSEKIMVMTAHIIQRELDQAGYPASLSHAMIQSLLREKINFAGVVITDDLQMKAVSDHYNLADASRLAINAGADILLFCNQFTDTNILPEQIIELIYQDVIAGNISADRIEQSYQRISELKKNSKNSILSTS